MITRFQEKQSLPQQFGILLALVIGAVALSFFAKAALEFGLAWKCPMLLLLDLPCPSCGSTRAFAALAELDFIKAVKFNPLMMLGTVLLPVLFLVRGHLKNARWQVWPIVIAAIALNWIYLFLFLPR
ncbi:MAG TPA: DUF2752 domain-containing protein [Candidatus Kapabacteria bacterium]|nr:DUF2752 domain-containing protein [Candidatus Kapabacteria bacterium]